jgi:hypothetical protein
MHRLSFHCLPVQQQYLSTSEKFPASYTERFHSCAIFRWVIRIQRPRTLSPGVIFYNCRWFLLSILEGTKRLRRLRSIAGQLANFLKWCLKCVSHWNYLMARHVHCEPASHQFLTQETLYFMLKWILLGWAWLFIYKKDLSGANMHQLRNMKCAQSQ